VVSLERRFVTGSTAGPFTVSQMRSRLNGWYVFNSNAAVIYMQFFDAKSGVVLGSTLPVLSFGIPAGSGANALMPEVGDFREGIVIAFTTARNNAVLAASPVDFNIFLEQVTEI
jgi:hypothetical protein